MESNRFIIFFIFGISLLRQIYSKDEKHSKTNEYISFPSLFLIKEPNTCYALADKFQYIEGQNNVIKFSTSAEYPLYSACPEQNTPLQGLHALQVRGPVTDLNVRMIDLFVKGLFPEYDCQSPVKPIVLKNKDWYKGEFAREGAQQYDIGYMIHEKDGNFAELGKLYKNLPKTSEYDFLKFLTVTMDKRSRAIISVGHTIIAGKYLRPNPVGGPFQPDEKNIDIFGFDVDSLYIKENQENVFFSITPHLPDLYYSHPKRILIKAQLAPHKDFLLNTWKFPTFMDLNTTSMWKQVYRKWKRVEHFVRKVARELETLTIETGTAQIFTVDALNGMPPSPVYLSQEEKSSVSKYFWKLVRFNQFHNGVTFTKAILIIMHNDPYDSNQEPICKDVGKDFGWKVSNREYKTGLTYACPVQENITSKLYDEFKVNYEILDLKNVQKLEFDEKGEVKWVNKNVISKIQSRC